jgi:cytochrome c
VPTEKKIERNTIMKTFTLAAALAVVAAPAFADGHAATQGDVAAGQAQFDRQCVACHVVADADGNVLAGRNARTGPNLYGVAGRTPGTVEGFRYGDSIVEYGETGATWAEENFVAYVQDPTDYLKTALDNRRARARMSYQVRNEQHAYDIYAYLASLSE